MNGHSDKHDATTVEGDANSIDGFCKRHGISRAYLYILWKRGDGPRYMQVGSRRLISREAAADWRRRMEADTAVQAA